MGRRPQAGRRHRPGGVLRRGCRHRRVRRGHLRGAVAGHGAQGRVRPAPRARQACRRGLRCLPCGHGNRRVRHLVQRRALRHRRDGRERGGRPRAGWLGRCGIGPADSRARRRGGPRGRGRRACERRNLPSCASRDADSGRRSRRRGGPRPHGRRHGWHGGRHGSSRSLAHGKCRRPRGLRNRRGARGRGPCHRRRGAAAHERVASRHRDERCRRGCRDGPLGWGDAAARPGARRGRRRRARGGCRVPRPRRRCPRCRGRPRGHGRGRGRGGCRSHGARGGRGGGRGPARHARPRRPRCRGWPRGHGSRGDALGGWPHRLRPLRDGGRCRGLRSRRLA